MSKHTPAPWVYDSFALREEIRSESNPLIAVVSSVHCSSPEQMRDNARLIAAAPLLYEAMQKAVDEEGIDDLGQICIGTSNTAAILTALKIARGE